MNTSVHACRWLLLLGAGLLLSACSQSKQAVCDDTAKGRARQFITQVLEQEAIGLRLRELASKEGRAVFYANVAYERAEEPAWDVIYVREAFEIADATCVSRPPEAEGTTVAPLLIDVRVQFPAGYWFDREAYGELPAGEHTYPLRLQDGKFKIAARLPSPFVSTKTAVSMLGDEPYAADELLELREKLVEVLQQERESRTTGK